MKILHFLKKEDEAIVGDIAAEIRLSFKATSKHLGILAAADFLEKDQRSLQVFYRITSHPPKPVLHILSIL